ncbi:MAG: sulfite exporter TauE/SafE family protein [Acidimicrobiia bacterium]|nr:sulfite exporter TauE/SafE family protein [Acidimicrobiia bacterium]
MHAGVGRDVLTLAAGVVTGIMSAAFGVGGATISTPAIRVLGASAFVAVGTTLPSIIPSAVSGSLRYMREGLVDWDVVKWAAPVGVATAILGSLLSHVVPGNGHWLMILTALLIGVTAWRMRKAPPRPAVEEAEAETDAAAAGAVKQHTFHRTPRVTAAVGAAAGLLSGLLGIGGGVLMVPGFNQVVGLRLKETIATSLVCVGIFAIPGMVTHAFLGDIDWRFALLLCVGVIPGARIGAHLAIRAERQQLRIVVASFLGIVALIYLIGEVNALVR